MSEKTFVVALILLFAIATAGAAQQPAVKDAKTEAPAVTLPTEAQQEILAAQRVATEARIAAEAANARYDAAQQRVVSSIYKALAELKLSPKEWQVTQDKEGALTLKKVEPSPKP